MSHDHIARVLNYALIGAALLLVLRALIVVLGAL